MEPSSSHSRWPPLHGWAAAAAEGPPAAAGAAAAADVPPPAPAPLVRLRFALPAAPVLSLVLVPPAAAPAASSASGLLLLRFWPLLAFAPVAGAGSCATSGLISPAAASAASAAPACFACAGPPVPATVLPAAGVVVLRPPLALRLLPLPAPLGRGRGGTGVAAASAPGVRLARLLELPLSLPAAAASPTAGLLRLPALPGPPAGLAAAPAGVGAAAAGAACSCTGWLELGCDVAAAAAAFSASCRACSGGSGVQPCQLAGASVCHPRWHVHARRPRSCCRTQCRQHCREVPHPQQQHTQGAACSLQACMPDDIQGSVTWATTS